MNDKYFPLDLILGKRKKIVVPHELYGKVIKGENDVKAAGHFALSNTITLLRALFYFPGMTTQTQHYLANVRNVYTNRGGSMINDLSTQVQKGDI